MQTKFIIYIVIVILVIAGASWYFVARQPALKEAPNVVQPPEEVPTDETADWKTYRNETLGIEFKYPKEWQLKEEFAGAHRFEGPAGEQQGFFVVSAARAESIDTVAESSAFHKLRPFGANPKITSLVIDNQEARLILPSDLENYLAEIIVRSPKPIKIGEEEWLYLTLTSHRDFIEKIAKTIKFIDETSD